MVTATATEMQNNFGRYLNMVINGNEVIVTKNGKEIDVRNNKRSLIPAVTPAEYLVLIQKG